MRLTALLSASDWGAPYLAVALGFEGLLKDEVVIGMEGNHDVLVAGVCSDRETARVIGEELAEQFSDD